MAKKKPVARRDAGPSILDQARDELFSHILRCGVLEAAAEHQKDWFDDTMDYLAERYEDLTDDELHGLRGLAGQYRHRAIHRRARGSTGPRGRAAARPCVGQTHTKGYRGTGPAGGRRAGARFI